LVRVHPDDVETQLLKAELNIAAEDFPAARKALGDLYETAPNARSLTLMAAVEKGSGADDAAVRGWLARAVTASRGPQWVCDSCNNIHGSWVPVCTNCNGFDTLSWREPPQAETSLTNSAEMLPLIVGAIEDQSVEVEEPPLEAETEVEPDVETEVQDDNPEPPTGTAEAAEVIELEPLKHEAPPAETEEEVENRASST
jgi:HemY protein